MTAPELARAAGIDERYAREWLEQQACAGVLDADGLSFYPDWPAPGFYDVIVQERGGVDEFDDGSQLVGARSAVAESGGGEE